MYGKIFKVNRILKGYSLENIIMMMKYENIGINSTGTLSRIENDIIRVKPNVLKALFFTLDMDFDINHQEQLDDEVDIEFNKILKLIIDGDNYIDSYKCLLERRDELRMGLSLPKVLLLELFYNVIHKINKEEFNRSVGILLELKSYFENYQLQFFYDTIGNYYSMHWQFQNALEYYELAETFGYHKGLSALVMYHKAMNLSKTNQLQLALTITEKAKNIFDKRISFKRSLHCYIQMATIHSRLGNYELAESMLQICIKEAENLSQQSLLSLIYNNLSWVYIRLKDYNKIIEINMKQKVINEANGYAYFYSSWAYFHLGMYNKAKVEIENAKKFSLYCDKYTKRLINIFSRYIKENCNFIIIEKSLLTLFDRMRKDGFDRSAIQFILQFIIEFYQRFEKKEKENEFLRIYLGFS